MTQHDTVGSARCGRMGGRLTKAAAVAALGWGASSLLAPTWAWACGGIAWYVEFALEEGGELPANALGLPAFGKGASGITWNDAATQIQEASIGEIIEAPGSLTEGDAVTVRIESADINGGVAERSFVVGPAADAPTALGSATATVVGDTRMQLIDDTPDCSSPYHVTRVDVQLAWDDSVGPWRDSAIVKLEVDGQPYRYVTYPSGNYPLERVRPSEELGEPVLAYCGTTEASETDGTSTSMVVDEGDHEVAFVALFADGSTVRTEPVAIRLQCGELAVDDSVVDDSDGLDVEDDGDMKFEALAEPPDGQGQGGADAGTTLAQADGDEGELEEAEPAAGSAGGCRATGAGPMAALGWMGLVIAGLWRRRKGGRGLTRG